MRHWQSFKIISPEDLQTMLQQQPALLLIDTLPAEHFNAIHLPGAVNACVYDMTFVNQINTLCRDSGAAIVLYGSSSNSLDSRTAAEKLIADGYSNISVLEGGIDHWRQSGLPLEGDTETAASLTDQYLLKDGSYKVSVPESRIFWIGRNPNSSHYGTVLFSGGNFTLHGSSIQGSLLVDMESIENINLKGDELEQVLITHLKSDDFFYVDVYPGARFDIPSGRLNNQAFPTVPNCELSGMLDLRGRQNHLNIEATVVQGGDGKLHLSSHFELDRTLWGIIYGSGKYYEHLGMHTVFDHISIELLVIAEKS
ncbi:rhodanese-like domain-containing protein [Desulfosediminicola sp.]|uniref:rhodanese-like domain-containing protein n=1 Tax=Desulfosediminicola sp. TaxID=2886825 RepID=UPI003AF20410